MKAILTSLLLLTLFSCAEKPKANVVVEKPKELPTDVVTTKDIKVIRLTDQLDHGLSRVIVNDTLEVLIYRGVESVSMIRVK